MKELKEKYFSYREGKYKTSCEIVGISYIQNKSSVGGHTVYKVTTGLGNNSMPNIEHYKVISVNYTVL